MVDYILVVDDDRLNRRALSSSLKKTGYVVFTAEGGQQALDILGQKQIDAILLDLKMPGMDGYQVLAHIKEAPKLQHIPVIITSILDDVNSIVRCLDMGATDYLPKPFNPVLLQARLQAALAHRRLQERNAELDAFARTVAHDLKSPLTSIIGMASLIRKHSYKLSRESLNTKLVRIEESSVRMNLIIDALLLLAFVSKGEIEIQAVDMGAIVTETLQRLEPLQEEYNPKIILPDSWPTAIGYAPWIEEVWSNFLSNALKYGGRPPHVELGATPTENGFVRFWVRDNGMGLTPEDCDNLFVPFSRLKQISVGGHGLGLSIVHRIIERLGGQTGIESKIGEGSIFWFTLPM